MPRMRQWICVVFLVAHSCSPAEEQADKVETIKVIDRERHGDRTRG